MGRDPTDTECGERKEDVDGKRLHTPPRLGLQKAGASYPDSISTVTIGQGTCLNMYT